MRSIFSLNNELPGTEVYTFSLQIICMGSVAHILTCIGDELEERTLMMGSNTSIVGSFCVRRAIQKCTFY